ncbi:MAG TPA: hypothetical protein VHE35_28750 [Kofleriaceae bacterium]|nr:hypothetical protein [Kofleriaceae bacterium]
MRTTTFLVAAAALAFAAGSGCTDDSASFTISNQSSYFLDEIHLAPIDSTTWGPDLIDSLAPGEDLVIDGISCGTYDVLVTDETGVDCQLSSVDICIDSGGWVIDDATLDACAFGQ